MKFNSIEEYNNYLKKKAEAEKPQPKKKTTKKEEK